MRGALTTGVAIGVALFCAASASGQSEDGLIGPYDGEIPFNCELQNVGTGTDFPDPGADPFCVEFDKTNQNVTDFGIVDFALQEPDRVAAAVEKCFYFQRDHWTGWIVQGSEPELWHWDGDYWFDIARGVGGASVRNFRLGGVPMSAAPFVPEAYRPYFDEAGGGGVVVELETNPPSHCTSKVDTPQERDRVYAGRPEFVGCIEPGGGLRGSRVGAVRLGMRRSKVVGRLGLPRDHRRGFDSWCLIGKGTLRVGYAGKDGGATLIRSSGRGHAAKRVARGDSLRRAQRRLELKPRLKFASTRVFEGPRTKARRLIVAVSARRVRWLALLDPAAAKSDGALRRILRRSG